MTIILVMVDTILRNSGTIVLAMVWWAASYWIIWTYILWKSQYYELADLRFNHWLQLSDSISLQLWTKNNRFQFRYHNISLNHPKKMDTLFPRIFPATTCLCEQCWGSNKSCWAPSRHNARCQSDIRPTSRWPRSTNTAGLGVSKYIHVQMCRCVCIYICVYIYIYMYM